MSGSKLRLTRRARRSFPLSSGAVRVSMRFTILVERLVLHASSGRCLISSAGTANLLSGRSPDVVAVSQADVAASRLNSLVFDASHPVASACHECACFLFWTASAGLQLGGVLSEPRDRYFLSQFSRSVLSFLPSSSHASGLVSQGAAFLPTLVFVRASSQLTHQSRVFFVPFVCRLALTTHTR